MKHALMLLYLMLLSLTVHSVDLNCPEYSDYNDCMSKCSFDTDPCAAYLGSCDYYCEYLKPIETGNWSEEPSVEDAEFDVDFCINNCVGVMCGDNAEDCTFRAQCVSYCSTCDKYGEGCEEYMQQDNQTEPQGNIECEDDCSQTFCRDGLYYYDGYCGDDGQCYYYTFECAYGCDEYGSSCEKPPEKGIPSLTVDLSKDHAYLNGKDSVKIDVVLTYSGGAPVKGARVYFELDDPKSTGMLGMWDRVHKSKSTDSNGRASITISFPDINGISKIYWDEFPYDLSLKVYGIKHTDGEEWKVEKSLKMSVRSPAPKIESISVNPKTVVSYSSYNISVEISDDKDDVYTYTLTSPTLCGKFRLNDGMERIDTEGAKFSSSDKSTTIEWDSIQRGLTPLEIALAANVLESAESSLQDVAATTTKEIAEERAEKIAAKSLTKKLLGWLVPIADTAWNIKGMVDDAKHFVEIGKQTERASGSYEGGLLLIDMGITTVKIYIGAVSSTVSAIPLVGKAATYGNDIAQSVLGSVRDYVDNAALRERILNSEPMEMPCMIRVDVEDGDGYASTKTISFPVRYVGFKRTQDGG